MTGGGGSTSEGDFKLRKCGIGFILLQKSGDCEHFSFFFSSRLKGSVSLPLWTNRRQRKVASANESAKMLVRMMMVGEFGNRIR